MIDVYRRTDLGDVRVELPGDHGLLVLTDAQANGLAVQLTAAVSDEWRRQQSDSTATATNPDTDTTTMHDRIHDTDSSDDDENHTHSQPHDIDVIGGVPTASPDVAVKPDEAVAEFHGVVKSTEPLVAETYREDASVMRVDDFSDLVDEGDDIVLEYQLDQPGPWTLSQPRVAGTIHTIDGPQRLRANPDTPPQPSIGADSDTSDEDADDSGLTDEEEAEVLEEAEALLDEMEAADDASDIDRLDGVATSVDELTAEFDDDDDGDAGAGAATGTVAYVEFADARDAQRFPDVETREDGWTVARDASGITYEFPPSRVATVKRVESPTSGLSGEEVGR